MSCARRGAVAGRLILTLIFLWLLALPALLRRPAAVGFPTAPGEALARYGFRLDDVAKTCGVQFTHKPPQLDKKLAHIMPQIASAGAAVAVADYDNDGYPDFYVTSSGEGAANALYHNRGDGTFVDVAAAVGLADLNQPGHGCSTGAVWGDYDNDGFEDLLVYKWGPPELYHNDGGRSFTRKEAGLPRWINANSAIWLDYDRDGLLDLFIAGYFDERLDLWHLDTTKMMPESFEYAKNGGRKFLLKNKGDGSFVDVTESMGITSRRWTLAVAAADVFDSGYPDLFLANDYGVSELYQNQKGKPFAEVGKEVGIGAAPKSGMNASFGDIFNQGREAVYVSNISEEGILLQGNNLWVPRTAPGTGVHFDNMAQVVGVELGGWSFGAQFGDLNNDGNLDLYLVNGYISANPKSSYWYDFTKVAGGHGVIISDAANWPQMNGRSLAGYQQKRVWLNDGAGAFTEVAQAVGVQDRLDGRAVALVDLWNRGVLDAVVANQCGPVLVYRNQVRPGNAWVEFALTGNKSNKSAIGARVTVSWKGRKQVQEIRGGEGFASQNDRRLHFGLGPVSTVEKVEIRWPSGQTQTLTALATNILHKVKEP
jgi:hypothetical protein